MICALCQREALVTTDHHLIPRTQHSKKRVRKKYSREEVKKTVPLCEACHGNVHATFTEKSMELEFNTLDKLHGHPGIRRFSDWIRGKSEDFVVHSKRRKHRG